MGIQSKILIVLIALAPQPALACKKFSIWHYPKPQRCFTALASLPERTRSIQRLTQHLGPIPTTKPEQITILLPSLDFEACQDGDERLQGIAKLRDLMNAR